MSVSEKIYEACVEITAMVIYVDNERYHLQVPGSVPVKLRYRRGVSRNHTCMLPQTISFFFEPPIQIKSK